MCVGDKEVMILFSIIILMVIIFFSLKFIVSVLQSNDRVPSAHSTASSYDHYNSKHERDQRPHSSHSRDDDRGSAKDSSQTPTRL